MRRPRHFLGMLALAGGAASLVAAPGLEIRPLETGEFRVSWPLAESGWNLEEAGDLRTSLSWEPVSIAVQTSLSDRFVILTPGSQQRFYRLRQGPVPLLTVVSTSPAAGESGVSVTRETVFHLSAPLAADTVLDASVLRAEAAGRNLLSRAELSSDRQRVTLFYGENLPAGARVQVVFGHPSLRATSGQAPDLAGIGQPGSTNILTFQTSGTSPLPKTAVVGRVLASQPGPGGVDVPLANVTITLDGQEQTIRTTTAADGSFRLEPVPAGRFYVNVDGRTATGSQWPSGAYYPTIGKAWEATAGRTNNPAGGTGIIYLPRVTEGTLQPISATDTTPVTFPPAVIQEDPRLAGVQINVPPNGLFADNGSRGGLVGLAPVASNRLPEPLPAGLNHALDISIQTSGPQNFSEPVPARFPNLPDPVTGETLPPGAKTALWSFNHDTGQWEMQGSMTVSPDGKFVDTDAGVGIRQAGWHGVSSGSSGSGGPPGPPPPCQPGGILPEGTSSCAPEQCDPSEAKRQMQLCFARASACALKCYEDCGTAGRPEDFIDVASMAKDCAEGARCAKECTDEGERCAERYIRCVLGGGIFSGVQRLGIRPAAEDVDPPVIAEAKRLIAEIRHSADLVLALNTIVSKAPTLEQLSPEDLAQAKQLADQIQAFHGGRSLREFFSGKARNFTQMVMNSPYADDIYPALSGYYVLEDLGNGLVRRGRTDVRGYLNNIILRPNTPYRVSLLFGPSLSFYQSQFISQGAGQPTTIPMGSRRLMSASDVDGDGIPSEAEFVLGTRADLRDSDADGIADLDELRNGSNPLDNQPPANGVVAALDTPGVAVDVAVRGNLALVADRQAGVAIVDVTDPLSPSLLQQVDTPGLAHAVAMDGDLGIAADGTSGIAFIDLASPANATLLRQVNPGGDFRCVVAARRVAYAGTTDGAIVMVDLVTGTVVPALRLPGNPRIEDLGVDGEVLYAWTGSQLHVISLASGTPQLTRTVSTDGRMAVTNRRIRLSLSPGRAHGAFTDGVIVFDRSDPLNPTVLATRSTAQRGWKQLVPSLPRIGLAADGVALVDDEPQDFSVYNLGPDGSQLEFVAGFVTPGVSQAMVAERGLAFLADGTAGLQVIHYLPFDTAGNAPVVSWAASFPLDPPRIESGQPGRVTAQADDDVYVREVQFFRDGELVQTDRSWPFEYEFVAPPLSPQTTNLRLRARAVDTAGNATLSDELVVTLVPDSTPPRVLGSLPGEGNVLSELRQMAIRVNEPLDPGTVSSTTVNLDAAGADLQFGTADDAAVSGLLDYIANAQIIALETAQDLAPGRYRIVVANVRDLAGNPMSPPYTVQFWVAPGGPGGDADSDGLSNLDEGAAGSSPFSVDTDGDGWADEVEFHDGKNPRDPASTPSLAVVARPAVRIWLEDPAELLAAEPRPILAAPPVVLTRTLDEEAIVAGPVVARPPVVVSLDPSEELQTSGPWIARPEVRVTATPAEESAAAGPWVGRPPVSIQLSTP